MIFFVLSSLEASFYSIFPFLVVSRFDLYASSSVLGLMSGSILELKCRFPSMNSASCDPNEAQPAFLTSSETGDFLIYLNHSDGLWIANRSCALLTQKRPKFQDYAYCFSSSDYPNGLRVSLKGMVLKEHTIAVDDLRKEVQAMSILMRDFVYFHLQADSVIPNFPNWYCHITPWLKCDLFSFIQDNYKYGMPEDFVKMWIRPVLSETELLHMNGLAHGDMHPKNIMVDQNLSGAKLVLIDFASVISFDPKSETRPLVTDIHAHIGYVPTVACDPVFLDLYGLSLTIFYILSGFLIGGRDDMTVTRTVTLSTAKSILQKQGTPFCLGLCIILDGNPQVSSWSIEKMRKLLSL